VLDGMVGRKMIAGVLVGRTGVMFAAAGQPPRVFREWVLSPLYPFRPYVQALALAASGQKRSSVMCSLWSVSKVERQCDQGMANWGQKEARTVNHLVAGTVISEAFACPAVKVIVSIDHRSPFAGGRN
jgi:hypothetical protein